MSDLSERELNRVRLRFLDLVKSFFAVQPDAEIMGRWRGIITALEKEAINPAMDHAVLLLAEMLAKMNLEQIREEFYTLFADPFSQNTMETTASFYIDGRCYGQTLVDFREYLKEAEIGKYRDITESEDSLVLMLDVMVTLVEENDKQGKDNLALQARLLGGFLVPFCTLFCQQLRENPAATFYSGCADYLAAYIELEQELMLDNE